MDPSRTAPRGVDLIQHLCAGQLSIDWDGVPWVEVDADRKNLEVDVEPVKDLAWDLPRLLISGGFAQLRLDLYVPRRLSELGWRVTLKVGTRPVARLGRDSRGLLGNFRLESGALPELLGLL